MRIPSREEREILLTKRRQAVALQIAVWETNFVAAATTVADDGTDVSHDDLDELLGIGAPGRTVTGKPLRDSMHRVH